MELKITTNQRRNNRGGELTFGTYTYERNNYKKNEMQIISYDLRDSVILYRPKNKMITYEMNNLKYYGTHIWN